ncbi:MAG TPA: rRNA maturation RNase YbeY [Firmicutes bacterium]|nr:rRNA maturation RNase YbeY [Bacillota bacterium]
MSLDIQFINQTTDVTEGYESIIKKVVEETIKQEQLTNEILECSFIFVDNAQIQDINKTYRHKDAVTDVITFAIEDEGEGELKIKGIPLPRLLGDVFISIPRCREQATDYGHSFERELSFLGVHGFLHLLGYDHIEESDEVVMFKKQEDVLNALGIHR